MIPVIIDLVTGFLPPGTGMAAMAMVPAPCLTQPLLAKFLNMQTTDHVMAKQWRRAD
jgi:hypothetical protein